MSPNNNVREGKKTNTPTKRVIAWAMAGRQPTRASSRVSGNPKGRRKKVPSFSEVTEQVLNETIEMRMGDRLLRMSDRGLALGGRQALAGKPRLLTVLPAIMRYERGPTVKPMRI